MKRFTVPFSISGDVIVMATDEADAIRKTDGMSLAEWAQKGELIVYEDSVQEVSDVTADKVAEAVK